MANRALQFTALGPLDPASKTSIGVEIRGSGLAARPVVLVYLPPEAAKDEARLAEIRARTESAMRLQHPNVIQVLGLENLDDGWARIVEYGDGESLRSLLREASEKNERTPAAVTAAILADACLGVHHAHETGEARDPTRPMLHGGLRSGTLMVTHTGRTKVTGFGAAVFAPTGIGALHAYLAPEQVVGGIDAITRQTDVYGLGAVLYELLAGGPPFLPEDGLLDQQILGKRPSSLRVAEQAELAEIALKAMSKKASDRYPTASAMREALLSCKSASPASAEVVARWLTSLMPSTHPARVARKALLDSAINTTGAVTLPSDVGSISGPGVVPKLIITSPSLPPAEVAPPRPSLPPPVAAPPPVATPPPVSTPSPAPASPVKRAPVRAISDSEIPEYVPSFSEKVQLQADTSRRQGMVGGLVVGMAIGGAAFWYYRTHQPEEPVAAPIVAAAFDAGAAVAKLVPPLATGVDAGSPLPGVDGGPNRAPAVVADAGAKLLALEISTDPPMDIRVDGKAVGHENATVTLTEGTHHIEASDRAVKAYASRDVDLRSNHQQESLTVGSSQLALDVPAGSQVTIDGKPYGTAPVEPAKLYSGTHEVLVDYNGAETTQTVHMHSDVNLTLTVHAN